MPEWILELILADKLLELWEELKRTTTETFAKGPIRSWLDWSHFPHLSQPSLVASNAQFKWSKTNWFGSKVLLMPVLIIQVHFCALGIIYQHSIVDLSEGNGLAFVLWSNEPRNVPVTHRVPQSFIKKCVARHGQDPGVFSSHNFTACRGILGILVRGARVSNPY